MRSSGANDLRATLLGLLVVVLALRPPEVDARGMSLALLLLSLSALTSVRRLLRAPALAGLALATPVLVGLAWSGEAAARAVEPFALFGVAALLWAVARGTGPSRAAHALAASGAAVGAWAVYQRLWGLAVMADRFRENAQGAHGDAILARLEEGRAFAGFVTPAALGGFFLLALPVTVALLLRSTGGRRVALAVAVSLQAAGFVSAASATAAGALLVALALWLGRRGPGLRRWWPLAAVAAAGLVAVVAIRGPGILDPTSSGNPLRLRAGNVRIAGEMLADSPWIGVGPGAYGEAYPRYRRAIDNEAQHAHNFVAEWTAELGLIFGLLAAALFAAALLAPWRAPPAHAGYGFGVAATAFLLQNLADFTAFFPSLLWTAVLLAALGAPAFRPALRARPLCLAGLVVAVAALGAGGAVSWSEEWLFGARERLAADDPGGARDLGARATTLAPWAPDPALLRAQLAFESGDLEAAALWTERAVALVPTRPVVRELRARVRLRGGDLPGAWADMREAARLYPLQRRYAERRDTLAERLAEWYPTAGAP